MNVFDAVKQSITTRQAAELYGVKVRRNNMAACPFHNDRTPSMKVDKRFHCFGCGADGDVIDFVSRLYGISSLEAAQKTALDFGISYDSKPVKRSQRKQYVKNQMHKSMQKPSSVAFEFCQTTTIF